MVAVVACVWLLLGMGPLSFDQSLLCHHMATVALHANQNQLSPQCIILAYLSIGIGFQRVQVVGIASSSLDPFYVRCFLLLPPTTGTRSSNTTKDTAVDTGSTKSESGPLGVMVRRVDPTSDSWFLDPCQTATEETPLSPIGQCLYPILEDAPQPHRVVSPSWCHK